LAAIRTTSRFLVSAAWKNSTAEVPLYGSEIVTVSQQWIARKSPGAMISASFEKGGDMRKLFTVLATAIVLLAGSALMKAEAAPMRGLGDPSPLKDYSPVETVGCWCGPYRCACRRYWGSRYGY
jgi:hypothetical protein